ncbi:hypothetical protein IFM89_036233, partial [Coptis chinensis]
MASHIGYPRMGTKRELKFALESFWDGKSSAEDLQKVSADLRSSIRNRCPKAGSSISPTTPSRTMTVYLTRHSIALELLLPVQLTGGEIGFDTYFSMARGNASIPAMEMTKWFDTNYHFIVPRSWDPTPSSLMLLTRQRIEYKEAK